MNAKQVRNCELFRIWKRGKTRRTLRADCDLNVAQEAILSELLYGYTYMVFVDISMCGHGQGQGQAGADRP